MRRVRREEEVRVKVQDFREAVKQPGAQLVEGGGAQRIANEAGRGCRELLVHNVKEGRGRRVEAPQAAGAPQAALEHRKGQAVVVTDTHAHERRGRHVRWRGPAASVARRPSAAESAGTAG
eukprot:3379358-Prymnesium_polylepis.2